MLSVWNPILSQGKETRPLSCGMTSCLTLHQIHSLTWHMVCTAQEDKRNYVSAFPHGVWWGRCQLGGLTTGRVAICCRQDLSTRFCVFPNTKDKPIKPHHPGGPQCPGFTPRTTRSPLAKKWCLCDPMSFSSLQNNVSALNMEGKLLRMHPGEPLHIKNRSYLEWTLPVSTLPRKPVGRHPRCRIWPEDEGVSISKAPGLEF